MDTSVFARTANPAVDRPLYFLKKRSDAENLVTLGRAQRISRGAIQLLQQSPFERPRGFTDGRFGVGNLVPFTRVPDPMKKPHPLHYEIPACGARSRVQLVYKINNRKFNLREELAQTAAASFADPSPNELDPARLLTMRHQVEA